MFIIRVINPNTLLNAIGRCAAPYLKALYLYLQIGSRLCRLVRWMKVVRMYRCNAPNPL
jgi:hypothetical protein